METKIKYLIILGIFSTLNCHVKNQEKLQISSKNVEYNSTCYTPNRQRGKCIRIRDCDYLWKLVKKKASNQLKSSELDFLRKSQCGNQDEVVVCCKSTEKLYTDILPTIRTIRRTITPSNPIKTQTVNLLPKFDQCAQSSFKFDKNFRIKVTRLDEFPWTVLIEYIKTVGSTGHHCAGSLINKRYVLTAAHCIKKISRDWRISSVRLGEHNTRTNPDCVYNSKHIIECANAHIDIPVEKFIVHENYNSISKQNDIALLRLSRDVTFNRYIKPICLPVSNNLQNRNLTGMSLEVVGWGTTKTGFPSTKKLKSLITAVSLYSCKNIYTTRNIQLQDNQICAGGAKGIDSCKGDSGGSLVDIYQTNGFNNYYLVGLVSFGPIPCGLKGWPGVYTKIGPFMNWIQQNLEP